MESWNIYSTSMLASTLNHAAINQNYVSNCLEHAHQKVQRMLPHMSMTQTLLYPHLPAETTRRQGCPTQRC